MGARVIACARAHSQTDEKNFAGAIAGSNIVSQYISIPIKLRIILRRPQVEVENNKQ